MRVGRPAERDREASARACALPGSTATAQRRCWMRDVELVLGGGDEPGLERLIAVERRRDARRRATRLASCLIAAARSLAGRRGDALHAAAKPSFALARERADPRRARATARRRRSGSRARRSSARRDARAALPRLRPRSTTRARCRRFDVARDAALEQRGGGLVHATDRRRGRARSAAPSRCARRRAAGAAPSAGPP